MDIPISNKSSDAILAGQALQLLEPNHCTRPTRSASSGTIVSVFYNSVYCQAADLPTNLIIPDSIKHYSGSARILLNLVVRDPKNTFSTGVRTHQRAKATYCTDIDIASPVMGNCRGP
jgi:hypothetical protein